jgi:hypothetical protein
LIHCSDPRGEVRRSCLGQRIKLSLPNFNLCIETFRMAEWNGAKALPH